MKTPHPKLARRKFLIRATQTMSIPLVCSRLFAAAPFWEKKQATEWNEDEREMLTTNSPWAHKTPLGLGNARAQGMDSSGSRGTFGGMRGADSNGISESGGRGGRGGAGSAPISHVPEVTIRWESAQPVLEATRKTLPPAFENAYAVSVTGLPPQVIVSGVADHGGGLNPQPPDVDPVARQRASVQRLLAATTLSTKEHERCLAKLVVQSADRASLIFGFDKSSIPLSLDDKEILFAMELGAVKMHAKFEPKRMIFQGKLAL